MENIEYIKFLINLSYVYYLKKLNFFLIFKDLNIMYFSDKSLIFIILGMFFIIFLGFPMQMAGCNPDLEGACISKSIIDAYSSGCYIDKNICKSGSYYYDCYNVYRKFSRTINGSIVCHLQTKNNLNDYSYAVFTCNNYKDNIFYKNKLTKTNHSNTCYLVKNDKNVWIAGISFYAIGGFCFLIALLVYFYDNRTEIYENINSFIIRNFTFNIISNVNIVSNKTEIGCEV